MNFGEFRIHGIPDKARRQVVPFGVFLNMNRIALISFGDQIAQGCVFASRIFVRQISDGFKIQIFKNLVQGIAQIRAARIIRDTCDRCIPSNLPPCTRQSPFSCALTVQYSLPHMSFLTTGSRKISSLIQ